MESAERYTKYLIIIPAVHVALCYLYLFFWQLGFAANVILFSEPTDIFRISIVGILPIYAYVAFMALTQFMSFSTTDSVGMWKFDAYFEKYFIQGFRHRYARISSLLLLILGSFFLLYYKQFHPGLFIFSASLGSGPIKLLAQSAVG